jgi:NitT/TauT family transport system permease protein
MSANPASELITLPETAEHGPGVRPWRGDWRLARDRCLLFLAAMAAWEIAGRFILDPLWISRPSLVSVRLWAMMLSGELWKHTERTFVEAALGLLLALVVGVPVGIAMARYKYASTVAEPFMMGLYSLPRVALAPLFIIWFGIDLTSKVIMAFSTVLFIFILNIQQGLKTADQDILDLFRTMHAPRSYVVRKVLLPMLVPWIIAALRIGVGLALVGAVVAELVGASAGLGWYIESSAGQLDTTGVFAGLVMLTVLAVAGNAVVAQLDQRFSSWRGA